MWEMLASRPAQEHCPAVNVPEEPSMLGNFARLTRPTLAGIAIVALTMPIFSAPSQARGPDGIADIAEQVIDAVVNISTSQNVAARNNAVPNTPNDPQLDEL